ncbi:Asp23/Gls24 family envelope stress response protein [Nocardioides sp. LML1-1-1.1]|uniref:Asp23/Gls24 family envelope stress response protein n=1 Tax=Nocardioides sp. LML1-1-1.1 TaxID=3135248 RepID=UPI003436C7CF
MALEPDDPLTRALAAARRTEPGWVDVSSSVMRRVASLARPGEPLLVHTAAGEAAQDDAGSHTYLSSRILTTALRHLLQSAPTHAPAGIDLEVHERRLTAVRVRLAAAYGVELPELGEQVRAEVLAVVRDLLGPDPDLGPGQVEIAFEDVVPGDPREV